MRLSTVLGIKRTASTSARMVTLGMILFGLLSLGFGVVTFYGLSTGTFVISMSEEPARRGIQLSEDRAFSNNGTSRLYADPQDDYEEATYSYLEIEQATQVDGMYENTNADYMAYTFYLRNSGNEMVDLTYNLSIVEVTKGLDEYIRLLIIIDDLEGNVTETMFMKPDDEVKYYPPDYPVAKHFISDTLISNERISMFQVGQVRKITIFMWIEGYDTHPGMERGSIKVDMKFNLLSGN
ncbi:MAG: hypothetical protein CVV63_04715 [Tenericutes bacterium HGW-Tenericutes-8]|nr:MAG: hypothetical protein CVV63_04715 [Tenericutes bacterium HGW-Tenericutes-8]